MPCAAADRFLPGVRETGHGRGHEEHKDHEDHKEDQCVFLVIFVTFVIFVPPPWRVSANSA
jgi:hypothetical protein